VTKYIACYRAEVILQNIDGMFRKYEDQVTEVSCLDKLELIDSAISTTKDPGFREIRWVNSSFSPSINESNIKEFYGEQCKSKRGLLTLTYELSGNEVAPSKSQQLR
jgi:hypothetical protein